MSALPFLDAACCDSLLYFYSSCFSFFSTGGHSPRWMDCEAVDRVVSDLLARYKGAAEEERRRMGPPTVERLWQQCVDRLGDFDEPLLRQQQQQQALSPAERKTITIRNVPSLFRIALLESRITSKVMSAVATRPVVTVFELEQEICLAENVPIFSCLGVGGSLSEWPVVQTYFQCGGQQIFRVTSPMVIRFLATHDAAAALRHGVGDARDLLNAFRFYYEQDVLPEQRREEADQSRTADSLRRLPARVPTTRALGIHIRDFAELVTNLRQEAAVQSAPCARDCGGRQSPGPNEPFLSRAAEAIREALASPAGCGTTRFSVSCTSEELRRWVLPPSWAAAFASGGPTGGLRLQFHVGPCGGAATADSIAPLPDAPSCPSSSLAVRPAPATHARRARRGAVISDDAPVGDPAVPSSTSAPPWVPPQGVLPLDIRPQAHDEKAVGGGRGACRAEEHRETADALLELEQCLRQEHQDPARLVSLLGSLPRGSTVAEQTVVAAFTSLADQHLPRSFWAPRWETPWVPLWGRIQTPAAARRGVLVEVEDIASPASLCWDVIAPSMAEERKQHWENTAVLHQLFGRDLASRVPAALRGFFVGEVGVSAYATVSAFLGFWRRAFESFDTSRLSEAFSRRYVDLFALCAEQDYRARVEERCAAATPSSSLRSISLRALLDVTAQIPSDTSTASFLFPLRGQWYRGADGLHCCGPRYQGFSGLYLKPLRGSGAAPLPCLCLDEEPHFAVEAVLQRCGVPRLSASTTSFVSLEHPAGRGAHGEEAELAAALHARISALARCVQVYLRRCNPLLYAMSCAEIRRRLRSLRVVLGYNVLVKELLVDAASGTSYVMTQRPRLQYVSSHDTVYGGVEHFTSPVLAEVMAEIFLPCSPAAGVRHALQRVLQDVLRDMSDANGEVLEPLALREVADAAQRRLENITPPEGGGWERELAQKAPTLADGADLPWEVSPTPSRVQRLTFPPGTDAVSVGVRPTLLGGQFAHNDDSPRGPGSQRRQHAGATHRSTAALGALPPEWDGDDHQRPHEVLSRFLSSTVSSERPMGAEREACGNSAAPPVPVSPPSPVETSDFMRLKRPRSSDTVSCGQAAATSSGREEEKTRRYAVAAERFAWEAVKAQYQSDPTIRVVWLNESAEGGQPYDLVVCREGPNHRTGQGSDRRILSFIEVKSTCSSNRHDFELSLNELLFAARYGSAYRVHRVYGASTSELRQMKVVEYGDIISMWRRGRLTLTGDVRVIPSHWGREMSTDDTSTHTFVDELRCLRLDGSRCRDLHRPFLSTPAFSTLQHKSAIFEVVFLFIFVFFSTSSLFWNNVYRCVLLYISRALFKGPFTISLYRFLNTAYLTVPSCIILVSASLQVPAKRFGSCPLHCRTSLALFLSSTLEGQHGVPGGADNRAAESVFGSGVHVGRSGNVNLSFRRMSYLDAGTVKRIMDDELKRTATSLQLNGNVLYTLGKELLMLPHIEQIDLESNRFQRVPEILVNMNQLWRINLSSNPLDMLKGFGAIARIPSLKSIALRDCGLTSIPEPIFRCPLLDELDVSNNEGLNLSRAPLANILNLKSLFISACNLSGNRLPEGLLHVKTLVKLDISENSFQFDEMHFFGPNIPQTLKVLHLRSLGLSSVPQAVATLRYLHSLDLSQNPIQTLDVLAGRLVKRIMKASASINSPQVGGTVCSDQTLDIPESVSVHSGQVSLSKVSKAGRIASVAQPIPLKRLSLSGCGLRTVPKYFHKLTDLEELDLSDNNELDDPNMTLFSLSKLRVLNVIGCPFADDPSKSRNEWYDIGKLQNLTQLDWEVWKGTSNISAYRTRIPIEICGLPLTSINEVPLRGNLFVNDSLETIINLLRDGYFKVDLAMDEATVYSHIEALKVFEQGRKFFFPNSNAQLEALAAETNGNPTEIHRVSTLLEDIALARLRVSISRYVFFLTVQAANYDATIIPPLDVMILHYAHIVINPVRYRADCEAICGRILNCNYRTFFLDSTRFAAAAKDSVLASKKVWNLMARTTQEGLVWLHYDFWYKRARRQSGSNVVAAPPSGIRCLPSDPFPTMAAAAQEFQELCKLHTAQDLSTMLDQAITAHFEEQGLQVFQQSVEKLFQTNASFFEVEPLIRELSLDWSRYVKYLALYALRNSQLHDTSGVVVETLADVPSFEPMLPRRSASLIGKRYDPVENDLAEGIHKNSFEMSGTGPYPEMKPQRSASSILNKKRKKINAVLQLLTSFPVPTVGLVYLLHAHRTAHVKYFQILTLFGLEANDITWENTQAAADSTSLAWRELYDENYIGSRQNIFLYEIERLGMTAGQQQLHEILHATGSYNRTCVPTKSALLSKGKRVKKKVSLLLGGQIIILLVQTNLSMLFTAAIPGTLLLRIPNDPLLLANFVPMICAILVLLITSPHVGGLLSLSHIRFCGGGGGDLPDHRRKSNRLDICFSLQPIIIILDHTHRLPCGHLPQPERRERLNRGFLPTLQRQEVRQRRFQLPHDRVPPKRLRHGRHPQPPQRLGKVLRPLLDPPQRGVKGEVTSAPPPGLNFSGPGVSPNKSFSFLGGTISPASPLYGEQLEPSTYQTMFSFTGKYNAVVCVPSAASIWAANSTNGCIDIFSACTGKLTSSLPPRVLLPNAACLTPSRISTELMQAEAEDVPKPTALSATATHVWVGYDNGNVAVYDHLTHGVVTEGCFHTSPVLSFGFFSDGTTVSGSIDGVLVHWDCETNNFEAITRIKNRDPGSETLSCLASTNMCWVVVCGFDSGAIHVTDISNGKHSASQRNHAKRITSLAVTKDLLFSSADDKMVNVWRYDATPLPANTYSIAGCGGTHIHSLKLLRRIPVNPSVSTLVLDNSTESLWVAYVDGLLERWSANQDDDFGVEEVVREGMLHCQPGQRVVSLHPIHSVETVQILSLATNGINNVWYGHYNKLEEMMNKSIVTLNNIISQDAVDTAAWRGRMEVLKKREKDRKGRYVFVLEELSRQRVLLRFYDLWKRRVIRHNIVNPRASKTSKMERLVLLQRRAEYKTARRFFSLWCNFYDRAQRRKHRLLASASLELATKRAFMASAYERWMSCVAKKRVQACNRRCVVAVERANRAILMARYFFKWSQRHISRHRSIKGNMTFSEDQMRMLESKSQILVLQRAMRKWHTATRGLPAIGAGPGQQSSSSLDLFAQLYSKLRQEQLQRGYLSIWQRWAARRKRLSSLVAVAQLKEKEISLLMQQRYFLVWQQFLHQCHVEKVNAELQMIGQQIHEAEENNKDVFEKLQLQKRIDQLSLQREKDVQAFEREEERLQELAQDIRVVQDHLKHDPDPRPVVTPTSSALTAVPMARHTSWYRQVLEQQRLLPSVLGQMPREDAIHHIMSQLKGNVINLYTDMSLFRQVKDQRRGGQDAAAIFVDAFTEMKRLVVPKASKSYQKTSQPLRWPLYMETLDSIPLHYCAPVLSAIKTMAISYDLLPPDGSKAMQAVSTEFVANADWVFLIFRACHLRRRPAIPLHNRFEKKKQTKKISIGPLNRGGADLFNADLLRRRRNDTRWMMKLPLTFNFFFLLLLLLCFRIGAILLRSPMIGERLPFMLLEVLGCAGPCAVILAFSLGFMVDYVFFLTILGTSASLSASFLWIYSRHLANTYTKERTQRIRIMRDQIQKSAASMSKADPFSALRNKTVSEVLSVNLDSDALPRSVARLSPVFPAFVSLILGLLALVSLIGAGFLQLPLILSNGTQVGAYAVIVRVVEIARFIPGGYLLLRVPAGPLYATGEQNPI
eukprot:gene10861-7527_t